MHKHIFLDTNVFEQFQPITDIDWLKLATCEHATLLVPTVTVRELNDHKDGATRGRLKRKAAGVLIELKKYLDQGPPVRVREGVDLDFRRHEPIVDFAAHHLDPNLDDDRLIASAIDFASEQRLDPEAVMVATGDFGLELKVSSQSSIRCLALPSELRLPDELDADEKRIKELEAENRSLKASRPNLSLAYKGGRTVLRYSPNSNDFDIEEVLRKTRDANPHRPVPELRSDKVFDFAFYNQDAVVNYNSRLDEYYSKMGEYLSECRKTWEWLSSTVELELELSNDGGSPAEDIDVRLTFPENVISLKEKEMPELPEKPEPPSPPSSGGIAAMLGNYGRVPDYALTGLSTSFNLPEFSNATIYSTGKGFAEFHVSKLKHLNHEELPKLYLHFKSGMKSCGLKYEIIAGNLPEAVAGELGLVIE